MIYLATTVSYAIVSLKVCNRLGSFGIFYTCSLLYWWVLQGIRGKKNIVLMLWMRIIRMGRDQPGRDRADSKNDPSLSYPVAV